MNLARRKLFELEHKLESLCAEFKAWLDLSERGQVFEKHHTQIRRIAASLGGFIDVLDSDLATVKADPSAALHRCRELEIDILTAHRHWDYFRRKLALRGIERFERFLFAADEFAWACYEPAQRKATGIAAEQVKEPPLVYFHGGSSPIATSREGTYKPEHADDEEPVSYHAFLETLKALPIPVVGIPWFQIEHLPDALVLGHEVGHNVEDDFQVASRVRELIDGAGVSAAHLHAWRRWAGEVFADLYGTLATGPAFVGALIDFLATDPAIIVQDRRQPGAWGDYPPDYLRVLLNLQFLQQRDAGFATDALAAEWKDAYGSHAMGEFEADLEPIAKALLGGQFPQFGGATLPEVLSYSPADYVRAAGEAAAMLQRLAPQEEDVRILFSAARLAFAQDPAGYRTRGIHALVLDKVPRKIGVRAEEQRVDPGMLESRITHDRTAGATLLRHLRAKRSGATPAHEQQKR